MESVVATSHHLTAASVITELTAPTGGMLGLSVKVSKSERARCDGEGMAYGAYWYITRVKQ